MNKTSMVRTITLCGRSLSRKGAAAVAGAVVLSAAASCASASAAPVTADVPVVASYSATAAQSNAGCGKPSGPVVHAFQVSSGGAPRDIKVSLGGVPGVGPMCITTATALIAVPAHKRALAYLYVELNKTEKFWRLWGATPSNVHRIKVTVDGGLSQEFVVGDPQKAVALGVLADRWHSFNTYTFANAALPANTVVTAYNESGNLLDSVVLA